MKVNLEVQCESNIMRENTIAAQKIIQIFLVVMIICNIKESTFLLEWRMAGGMSCNGLVIRMQKIFRFTDLKCLKWNPYGGKFFFDAVWKLSIRQTVGVHIPQVLFVFVCFIIFIFCAVSIWLYHMLSSYLAVPFLFFWKKCLETWLWLCVIFRKSSTESKLCS